MIRKDRFNKKYLLLVGIVAVALSIGTALRPAMVIAADSAASDANSLSETALGDLFADAVKAAVKADAGLIASSEIRPLVPPPTIEAKNQELIRGLVNYPEETVTIIEITGKQLTDALEQSVSSYPKPTLRFLQVSGISFSFDANKPVGSRINQIKIKDKALSMTQKYRVAVTRSLARGALGYWKYWSRDDIKSPDNPPTLMEAVANLLKKDAPVNYNKLDRIKVIK